VKEYGEGVNRMFEEMKIANLPEPIFYRNNFMLQTVIRNKKEINYQKTFPEKVYEKLPIHPEKLPIEDKKLPIEQLEKHLEGKNISNTIRKSIVQFFQTIEMNQVFGRKEVEKIVNCSYRNAGNLISTMKELVIIEVVPRKGKGKYIIKPFQ
jgi:ATP-dependent DNA helicase RecG